MITNMITERQRKKAEDQRRRNANLTEEQRLKKMEYHRNRRANRTEEERLKVAEYDRKRNANPTEHVRLRKAEYDRRRRATMTEEEKLKNAEKRQRKNMNEEARMKLSEYYRKRSANITDEKKSEMSEYKRKWYARMTEKEKVKKAEHRRQRDANMTEEERMRRSEYHRKWRAKLKQKQIEERDQLIDKFQEPETEEQLFKKSGYNPLNILIKKMIGSNMNVGIIPALPENLFKRLLKLIGIDYMYKRKKHNFKSAIQNLVYEIDICYLVELLRKWNGWVISNTVNMKYFSIDESYDALLTYLKSNVLDFKSQREAFLLDELNNMFNSDNFIDVSCSLNQLQNSFYHSPHNHIKLPQETIIVSSRLMALYPKNIIHWPYVSTQITLPNFTMTHQNDHMDEYDLINIANGLKTVNNECVSFYVKKMVDVNNPEKYLQHNVAKFLNQLTDVVFNEVSDNLTGEKKTELITVLTQFEKRLEPCPDILESTSKYIICTPYPYARYLGVPDGEDIHISMADQKAEKNSILNIRLRQIRYPKISVFIENFNVPCDIINNESRYEIDECFLRGIDTCITYDCLLCNEGLGSSSPSQLISDHFLKYHGLEPDWECTNCLKTFTNDYLLNCDWKHDCQ